MNRSDLTLLRNALADLYPGTTQARRIAFDAELDLERVDCSGDPQTLWFNLLTEATQTGRLEAVIRCARREYPEHLELRRLDPDGSPNAVVGVEGGLHGKRWALSDARPAKLGRALDAEIRLPEDDKKVSRYHAMILRGPLGYMIRDLHSRNHTRLNDRVVVNDELLHDGDTIRIGRTELRVMLTEATQTACPGADPAPTKDDPDDRVDVVPTHTSPPE